MEWMALHKHQRRYSGGPWWCLLIHKLAFLGVKSVRGGWRGKLFWFAQNHSRGLCLECTSPWYIFDHVDGGNAPGEQLLAVYAAGDYDLRLFGFAEIVHIIAAGEFEKIPGFAEHGDCGVLASSLLAWVEDCDTPDSA